LMLGSARTCRPWFATWKLAIHHVVVAGTWSLRLLFAHEIVAIAHAVCYLLRVSSFDIEINHTSI
jgi:hypothetical protein